MSAIKSFNKVLRSGFTMVELALSMSFISLLSIIIVLLITDAVSTYHRGITLNQVNSVGSELVDDIRTSIEAAPGWEVANECDALYKDSNNNAKNGCTEDHAMSFTQIKREAEVKVGKEDTIKVPIYGIYCTGSYSYIWNSGYLFSEDATVEDDIKPLSITYKIYNDEGEPTEETFPAGEDKARLIKIEDPDRMVCKIVAGYRPETEGDNSGGNYYSDDSFLDGTRTLGDNNGNINIATIDGKNIDGTVIEEAPVDLLDGDVSLALYDLTAAEPAKSESATGIFHSVSMIIGTLRGGINIMASGNYCETPEGDSVNLAIESFDYCAINKINFAARAIGE